MTVAGDAVPAVAVGAVGEQAEREAAPGAVDAVDRDGADRIVDADLVEEEHRFDHQDAGDQADEAGAARADEGAGAVMATRPASMPLHIMRRIGLLGAEPPHPERGAERAGRGGEHRVDGDDGDAQVGAGEASSRG